MTNRQIKEKIEDVEEGKGKYMFFKKDKINKKRIQHKRQVEIPKIKVKLYFKGELGEIEIYTEFFEGYKENESELDLLENFHYVLEAHRFRYDLPFNKISIDKGYFKLMKIELVDVSKIKKEVVDYEIIEVSS